jgi:hypothetical protein
MYHQPLVPSEPITREVSLVHLAKFICYKKQQKIMVACLSQLSEEHLAILRIVQVNYETTRNSAPDSSLSIVSKAFNSNIARWFKDSVVQYGSIFLKKFIEDIVKFGIPRLGAFLYSKFSLPPESVPTLLALEVNV